jgi:hypothetical protein
MDIQKEYAGLLEAFNSVYASREVEQLDEGMTMKDFKQQRSRQKQKDKREAEKTSPTRRAGIHADKASPERAARHRANVDPDFEGNDERNYPGGKLRPNKVRKAKALGELGEQVDLFDYILEHLVAEGYAETNEAAIAIMANMSEEWKQSIIEQTARIDYTQDKFNRQNAEKSGSGLTYIPGKQNAGQALQKAKESARQMGKLEGA